VTRPPYTAATATLTRYEPTQAEIVLARLSPHGVRTHLSDAELQAMRLAHLTAATNRTPRPRVGIYTMVERGQDPAPRLAIVRALAVQHGWTQPETPHVDFTGMTDPATRPQLARLLTALEVGEIDGVAAASRTDFTHLGDFYEDFLHQIHARSGFLALASPETGI
jgi:hypothetical protein